MIEIDFNRYPKTTFLWNLCNFWFFAVKEGKFVYMSFKTIQLSCFAVALPRAKSENESKMETYYLFG